MTPAIIPATMVFGRFQPPTCGHEAIFNKIQSAINIFGGANYIFISPTVDKKNNPLSFEYRLKLLDKLYPNLDFVNRPDIKNPFDALCELGKLGFRNIILLCGPDRVKRYCEFSKYINHPNPEKCIPNVQNIQVINCGIRDINSNDVIKSASATKAREAVRNNDFTLFQNIIPEMDLNDQVDLYTQVKIGLS